MARIRNLNFKAKGNRNTILSVRYLWPKECGMKTSILVVLAIAGLIPGALAQDQAGTNSNEQDRHAGVAMASKPLMVSGKVSPDGKTLVTDIDSEWLVSNPETLKGHEGRRVTVKCYVDTEKSRIQVLRVKKEESELKYAGKHDDSAFRR